MEATVSSCPDSFYLRDLCGSGDWVCLGLLFGFLFFFLLIIVLWFFTAVAQARSLFKGAVMGFVAQQQMQFCVRLFHTAKISSLDARR